MNSLLLYASIPVLRVFETFKRNTRQQEDKEEWKKGYRRLKNGLMSTQTRSTVLRHYPSLLDSTRLRYNQVSYSGI
jgi:hypothetical protein